MELIKISESDGKKLVSARELHQFLEIRSKFADWIKNRIEKYGFVENFDYTTVSKNLENGGRELDYALSLDMGKELAMVEGNAKGKEARIYFIQCERRLQEVGTALPTSQGELILMLAQQNVANEQRIKQIEARTAQLEAKYNTSNADYYTIMGYANLIKKTISYKEAQSYGQRAVALSQKLGLTIDKVKDARFGVVNSYALEVLERIIY